ncbi:MAG TPA: hypothetical protein VGD15_22730 [Kribbella sp.]
MKLTDLREELATRAASTDDHATDLLTGAHRKIRRTKQRRAAAALGAVAVIAAFAIGLLPGLTSTSAPEPAEEVPSDYLKDGVTLRGVEGGDPLDKAWIGKPGEGRLDFTWTPTTNSARFFTYCSPTSSLFRHVQVKINDVLVEDDECGSSGFIGSGDGSAVLRPEDARWLDIPIGKPARVSVYLFDPQTRREGGSSAQLGIGIYRATPKPLDTGGAPWRVVPPAAGDYSKDGISYRAKVGGDTLAAAGVGDPGQSAINLKFTGTGARLILRSICTANKAAVDETPYQLSIRIGSSVERRTNCDAGNTDAGGGGGLVLDEAPASGTAVDVAIRIVDAKGRPVTAKGGRLGLGVYFQGAQRIIDDGSGYKVSLDEVTEVSGYTYKLAEVKTADAATARRFSIEVPTDKPYVLAAGSTSLGGSSQIRATVSGPPSSDLVLSTDRSTSEASFGLTMGAEAPGATRTATLELVEGKPTKGKYVLAVYLPQE